MIKIIPYILMYIIIMISAFCVYNSNILLKDKIVSNQNKMQNLIFSIFCVAIMAVLSGLKHESVGADTKGYLMWFHRINTLGFPNAFDFMNGNVEKGYIILNLLIGFLTDNAQIFMFIISVAILSLHISFIYKNTDNLFISVTLFFSLNCFITSMLSWRQYLSMGIILWLYPCLLKRKYVLAVILIYCAYLFHFSSLIFSIMLIFVFISNKLKISSMVVLLASFLMLGLIIPLRNIVLTLIPKYDFYSNKNSNGIGSLRIIIVVIFIGLVIYAYFKYGKCKSIEIDIMSKLLIISSFISIAALYIPYIFRLGYYFDYYFILFLPKILSKKKIPFYISIAFGIVGMIMFIYYLSTNAGLTVPYKFYFES